MPQFESTKRKKKKQTKPYFFIFILILAVIFTVICIKQNRHIPVLSHVVEEISAEDEWKMILVNKWNPLPENHTIETAELSNGECVDKRIFEPLQKMFSDMEAEGIYPIVVSGYRTQQEQEDIYNEKITAYENEGMSYQKAKEEAERWVAVPGTSEHQLGLAVDINADGVNSAGYEVYNWLNKNAYRYGFINRYPNDKIDVTGISNEPWHYRYVGEKAADEINKWGICLEEYLGRLN